MRRRGPRDKDDGYRKLASALIEDTHRQSDALSASRDRLMEHGQQRRVAALEDMAAVTWFAPQHDED